MGRIVKANALIFEDFLDFGDRGCTSMTSHERMIGGAEGDRTLDLRIANAALSQLSYRPTARRAILASPPRTSNQSAGCDGRGTPGAGEQCL